MKQPQHRAYKQHYAKLGTHEGGTATHTEQMGGWGYHKPLIRSVGTLFSRAWKLTGGTMGDLKSVRSMVWC